MGYGAADEDAAQVVEAYARAVCCTADAQLLAFPLPFPRFRVNGNDG